MTAYTNNTYQPYTTPIRIWIILGVIFIIFGSLILWSTSSYQDRMLKETYNNAALELSANASTLSSIMESRISRSNGLYAYVTTEVNEGHDISQASFEAFASRFISNSSGIRNLSIYPDGIAKFIYPLQNNEELLDLNLLTHTDSDIRLNAERTMQTNSMTILGPFELTQGGLGILTRHSIFKDSRFWGFVSVVLDVPPILKEAGLFASNKGIELALKADTQILLGNPQLFESNRLRELVALPEGSWELSALPKQAMLDSVYAKVLAIQLTSLLSLILFIYFLYIQFTKRAKLQALVNDRTVSLERTHKQLEATFNELASTEEELRKQYELLEHKESTVRHMAYHDSITDLYNRAYFNDCLEKLIISEKDQETHRIALLFLDLDHFKITNDTIGHVYGDILLTEVGRRLQGLLSKGEIISRIGGDEFTIIVPEVTDDEYVQQLAHKVIGLFRQPFILKDMEHFVTTSIGVALYPDHGVDASTLIMNADMAMYRAKDEGKNQYRFYDYTLNPDAEKTMQIRNNLSRALDRDEFLVYYQPQVEALTDELPDLRHCSVGTIRRMA